MDVHPIKMVLIGIDPYPFLLWDPNSADQIGWWNSAAPTGRGLRQQPADLSDMKKKVDLVDLPSGNLT